MLTKTVKHVKDSSPNARKLLLGMPISAEKFKAIDAGGPSQQIPHTHSSMLSKICSEAHPNSFEEENGFFLLTTLR